MSAESSVVMYAPPGGEPLAPYQPQGEQQAQVNILALVHKHLRGRYAITILLAAVGALGGAAAGYLLPTPKYRADGFIRIQPVMPRILFRTEESTLQPMFASFVSTQASLLQQPRVRARAMQSAAWRELGRAPDPQMDETFRKQLVVRTSPQTPELIFVSFSDTQANASLIAVREVILAYQELYGGVEAKNRQVLNTTLNTRKSELETEKRDLENKIRDITKDFETDDLARLSEHSITQMLAFDTRAAELALKLSEAGIDPTKLDKEALGEVPKEPEAPPAPPTPAQIAVTDPTMAQLLADRDSLRRELDRLRGINGEDHRVVQRARSALEAIEQTIATRAADWAEPAPAPGAPPAPLEAMSPRALVASYLNVRKQADAERARAQLISRARSQIEAYKRLLDKTQEDLDGTIRRLDEISIESKGQESIGRIDVEVPDAPPSTPNDDPRIKFAAMGLLLGGGFPVALMLLLGLIDRRFRYADQAGDSGLAAKLLGVLPELPGSSADPEQIAAAVHTVHHIRTRLRLSGPTRKVYAITSPLAGDGKTSLSLSLAISYTASGARTLLIDFDLVGAALTTRLGARCERGLGQHLVFPDKELRIVETAVPGLSLIPAGTNDIKYQSRVTPEAFELLIADLRNKYDIIVVDTGPILGSLEANIAASVADGVILVVGRGMHNSRVREAVDHLVRIGARLSGMVFNRAYSSDFNRSNIASVSFRSVRSAETAKPETAPARVVPGMESLDTLSRTMAIEHCTTESPS